MRTRTLLTAVTLGCVGGFASYVFGAAASYVEFGLRLPAAPGNPYEREVSAWVRGPGMAEARAFPAYYDHAWDWRVRVHGDATGKYILERVSDGDHNDASFAPLGPTKVDFTRPAEALDFVRIDPQHPTRLATDTGEPYLPLGMNLGWGRGDFYPKAFGAFRTAGLNWTRVWLVSWNETAIEWLADDMGPSPAPGRFDDRAGQRIDEILAEAEAQGVRVQLVLQQHGQFSTEVNPTWPEHPWNVAQGGFLENPGDFFTDPRARRLTEAKYRYLVARYGHSPAILAWELFNEVHFTDAYRLQHREADIACWHDDMAGLIRRYDVYHHLVTTSLDDLASPIYRRMDMYQPHLYAVNMLTHIRRFPRLEEPLDRPLFYGEVGDNHMLYLGEAGTTAGVGLLPSLWSGLMTSDALPAQAWYWERILNTPLMAEMKIWSDFVEASGLAAPERTWHAGSPATTSATNVPTRLYPGPFWDRRDNLAVDLPTDGSEPVALADLPTFFAGSPKDRIRGFPDRFTFRFSLPAAGPVVFDFADIGAEGATSLITEGEEIINDSTWLPEDRTDPNALRPTTISLDLAAGPHALTLRNFGPDGLRLSHIELPIAQSVLTAASRQASDRILLYVWHRRGVHAVVSEAPAEGIVTLTDVPAGTWRIVWWDPAAGPTGEAETRDHPGGPLALPTPTIARHAAALLTLLP